MNKNRFFISTLIIFGVLGLGSFSNVLALATQDASNASFHMFQAPNYFLKGSFNSWTASLSYLFTDNTGSMTPEANKVKELIISKNLSKDDEFKVWDTTDTWYTQGVDNCTYEDKWNRTTDNGDNYVVPMTASYEIKLKIYSNTVKKVSITAPNIETLYLLPNSNWTSASARFAAYFFNGDGDPVWRSMTDSNSDGIYEVSIPSGYSSIIFCRMNPGILDNRWNVPEDGDNKPVWNQTADLDFSITSYINKFTIPGSEWDNSGSENWGSL